MSRATFSTTFYCRSSKVNKQGLAPLELSIIVNGERLFLNLPSKLNPLEFNRKRKPAYIEDLLNTYRVKINEVCTDLMSDGMPITSATLREYLKTGGTRSKTLENLFEEYLGLLDKRVGKSMTKCVYSKYVLVRDFVFEVLSPSKELCTLTNADMVRLYDVLKEKYLVSTAGGYMTKIKTIITYAIDNGYMKTNPLNGIKINKGTSTITYLTKEDLNTLKGLDLEDYPRLERVRDLMLFQASVGLAYVDLLQFDLSKVEEVNGVHIYQNKRQKTGVEFCAVILQDGLDILKKYDNTLPMLSNQKYNQYLKEIGKLGKIKTLLTTHLLRRTYATLLLNSGVNISAVSKMLGHSQISITQKAYAKTTSDLVIAEMKNKVVV